MHIYFL